MSIDGKLRQPLKHEFEQLPHSTVPRSLPGAVDRITIKSSGLIAFDDGRFHGFNSITGLLTNPWPVWRRSSRNPGPFVKFPRPSLGCPQSRAKCPPNLMLVLRMLSCTDVTGNTYWHDISQCGSVAVTTNVKRNKVCGVNKFWIGPRLAAFFDFPHGPRGVPGSNQGRRSASCSAIPSRDTNALSRRGVRSPT